MSDSSNETGAPVALHPWARIRRDTMPKVEGYYILHEGMLGLMPGSGIRIPPAASSSPLQTSHW